MVRFIGDIFLTAMACFICNALRCVSINNQECKLRREITNINSNEPLSYPKIILVNKLQW